MSKFDTVAEPEDVFQEKDGPKFPFGTDVTSFARFMRATKAPPRDPTVADADTLKRGKELFTKAGCAVCHVPDWTTVSAGTKLGDFTVPTALGGVTLHPYSDFMLHDVGTGDGIVQTQHAQRPAHDSYKAVNNTKIEAGPNVYRVTAEAAQPDRTAARALQTTLVSTGHMIRTAPLWGMRSRPQLMHDGLSLSIDKAIRRHGNQAYGPRHYYAAKMTQQERDDMLAFLSSL